MKVVGYLRVSSNGQAENGLGLEIQREQVQALCHSEGHQLVGFVADEGVSGRKDAWERAGLTEALGMLEQGLAEGLVVARLDRLARSLTVQEGILATIWRHGGQVFTYDTGLILQDDPDDPMRTAMRQMAGVFAELERAMLVKRLRDGRKLKTTLGGHGVGAVPFGFRSGDWGLEEDPTEQETVSLVRALNAAGWSTVRIAAELNDRGLRTKRGGAWFPSSVGRVVRRVAESTEKGAGKTAG